MFTISDSAARRIEELLEREGKGSIFRLSIIGGGCSGFQYKFDFVPRDNLAEDDKIFFHNGSEIVVDSISQQFLETAILDYAESLQGSEFVVTNPEATSKCGCGSSFSI